MEITSHCVGPLTRDYLSKLPHHIPTCMNLHRLFPLREKLDVSNLFLKQLPYRSTIPIPSTALTSTSCEVLNGLDPTTGLIRKKIKWQMKKEKILNAAKKDRKNISEKMIRRAEKAVVDENTLVPQGVSLLAQHLDKDPDPQFSGVYNWYYTGGTLAALDHKEDHYLLHSDHSKLQCSRLNEEGHQANLSYTLDLQNSTPIHQIVTSAVGIGVRQKSNVTLFTVSDSDNQMCLNKIHSVSDNRNPFLSVALRDKSIRKYCTLSNNGVLKLWDVEYAKNYKMKLLVGPGEGVTVSDRWSSLMYVDSRTLLLADRCCIHLLDARTDMKEKQLAWCPKKLTEECEEISYIVSSQLRNHVVYTMTTHQALTLDLRFGFCQRWTHMMAAPPYMGFAYPMHQDHELLCLGSQVMSDCVIMVNGWGGEDPHSQYKPSSLPSPSMGLFLARQQGVCLNPTLSQRCSQSMIGLTRLPTSGGLHIIRQSATGDIFTQQLGSAVESTEQLTEKQLAAYSDWSKPTMTLQRDVSTVTVTEVNDFTPIFKALSESYPPAEEASESAMAVGGGWRLSKKYLEECVDLLAGRLLAVWEVEDEVEWQEEGEEETLVEQDPAEKVQNWLDAGNSTTIEAANNTSNERNGADMPTLNSKVTSTPFYATRVEQEESPTRSAMGEPSPWMTYPGQVLPQTPHKPPSHHPSSPLCSLVSFGSNERSRKRQKLFEDTFAKTPPKQPMTGKKTTTSSAKKKFIPGF